MKFKSYLILTLFSMLSAQTTFAQIMDCPVVRDNGIIYQSHSDYVEAYADTKENDDFRTRKILWHTKLLENDKVYNPNLETDVQWNITCVEHVTENNLIVSDKRSRRFILDKQTGKLLKTIRYELFYSARIDERPIYQPKSMAHLKNAGDYVFVLKRMDYINHSALIIYKDPSENTDTYDIMIILSSNTYYLLSAQNTKTIEEILNLFKQDKPINTKTWQSMTEHEFEEWYGKKYIAPKLLKIREQ